MQIRLFVTAQPDQITGGHAYDRRMLAALRAAGHDAELVLLDAGQGAAAAWRTLPDDAVPLIDGQALAAFLPLRDALVARGAAVLVHHPTALEPGLSEAEHDVLCDAERQLLPILPRVVVASTAVAARLTEVFGVSNAQLAIVPPGVDPACRSKGSGGPGCAILSIGALVPRKGHDLLLRALARLFDLDWRLTIVGTPARHPAHAAALRDLTADLAIVERVRFAGVQSDAALDEFWGRADIFALATHWEATPGATADALRRGIPVAVSNGGAAAALVTLNAGVTVPPGDVDGFSRGLRRLIFDAALRAEMADAAWQAGAALPSWDTQAELLVAALSAA